MDTETSRWIYLSPHLDDVVLSCGGLIWQQVQKGLHVEIWSIFAGDPPSDKLPPFAQSLHARWKSGQKSTMVRRLEDMAACDVLQVTYRHFDYPDCIYRVDDTGEPVIMKEEDLFQPQYSGEQEFLQKLTKELEGELPQDAVLVAPYGFGHHIDHQLVRRAAEIIGGVWLYADYPYSAASEAINQWLQWTGKNYQITINRNGLEKWQEAVAAYKTQLSTFWISLEDMQQKTSDYFVTGAGSLLHQL